MPGDLADRLDDPAGSSAREASPGRGTATATTAVRAVDRHALDHAQLDDRAAQLGLLDRRQGGLDVDVGCRPCCGLQTDFHYGHR